MITIRWSDCIILIGEKGPEDGDKTNDNGFAKKTEETRRQVFGNQKAAWQSEFYRAQQYGYKVECNFEMYAADYQGEALAELNGKRFRVLRTDLSKSGERITLVLSDLSERGVLDGET